MMLAAAALSMLTTVPLCLCVVVWSRYNDDDFNWNFGIAQAVVGNYKEAEETLLLVLNEKYHQE